MLRLKGGDPYVFGRGAEEALVLARSSIPFRIVPGLTAGLAGLAAAGIPATVRGINQAIVLATGHSAEGETDPVAALDWDALARLGPADGALHGGAQPARDSATAGRGPAWRPTLRRRRSRAPPRPEQRLLVGDPRHPPRTSSTAPRCRRRR